ncbi:MAG: hypothetical protein J5825_11435 [Lachnospiraceae bacterium]|nr:hypothetical protein [Lachnospiraceae bacterium]
MELTILIEKALVALLFGIPLSYWLIRLITKPRTATKKELKSTRYRSRMFTSVKYEVIKDWADYCPPYDRPEP